MKVAAALLVVLNIIGALAVAAFLMTYSIVETDVGGEFLILKAEQAKECRDGGGCAVFSQREFSLLLTKALRNRL